MRGIGVADKDKISKEALKNICIAKGGKVIGDQCSYKSKASCDTSYTWPIQDDGQDTYVEWKNDNNGGSCQMASFAMKAVCQMADIDYDRETGSCKIDRDYCRKKGANWEYNDKIKANDCTIPTGQEIAELLIGTTMVRGLKQIFDPDQYEPCKPNEFDNGYTCSGCPENSEVEIAQP